MGKLRQRAVVLNGFIHDFATGYWLASMITITLLHRFHAKYPALATPLSSLELFFFWNSIGAVVVVLATGGARKFTYVDNMFGEAVEQTRRQMLIIKHVILAGIFIAGGYCAFRMAFH